MSRAIVNLALPVVREKIETILMQYPCHPHQTLFTAGDWHQKLLAYVVARMPATYAAVEDGLNCDWQSSAPCYSPAQETHMGHLIRQGIDHLVHQYQAEQATMGSDGTVSNWFG